MSEETLIAIFSLQRQLVEGINEAAATEAVLFEQFGETEATSSDLQQLQNARERLTDPYSRLCTLLLRIAESQPTASAAMLSLLRQTIERAEVACNAVKASTQETKRDWNLP